MPFKKGHRPYYTPPSGPDNPLTEYRDKLKALPDEERERIQRETRAKLSASVKKHRAVERIVNNLLKAEYDPLDYERDVLTAFGYEIDECGLPTVAVMVLCAQAVKAIKGNTAAAQFLFSYGGVPDIDQVIEREKLKEQSLANARRYEIEREKLDMLREAREEKSEGVKIIWDI